MAESPRGFVLRPDFARLLVSAHQHSAAFLSKIELAVEVDRVQNFLSGRGIDGGDFRHVIGDQVHVFHGEHRVFPSHHASHFPRP